MEPKSKNQPAGNIVISGGSLAGHPHRVYWICALLAAMVVFVYWQTPGYQFVNYDDNGYVYENSEVIRGITPGGVVHAFTHKDKGLWNPLVTISHMLDCQFYGLNAGGHHLTNVALHLASTLLLFLALRQMTGATWRSAFVAALFAVHPLRVESVAWISERKDVLSGLFFMLTLLCYIRYVRRPPSVARYLGVLLLFLLGMMCKLMLMTLPMVLLLLDYWPLNRLFAAGPGSTSIHWRVVWEKVPMLAISCLFCAITLIAPKSATSNTAFESIPFLTRIEEAPVWYAIYLRDMIYPAGLAVVYPHPEESLPWWPWALALLGLMTLGTFLLRRKCPWLWVGWLWNLGMLVPVSGIVQISRHARADHYNYLPQIGLYLGLAWAAAWWGGTVAWRRRALGCAGVVLLCFFAVAARKQASYWKDGITLWTHTLECTTGNFVAHSNLGLALQAQGRIDEAMAEYRKALEVNPETGDALVNLGLALSQTGRPEEAVALYRKALQTDPANVKAVDNLGVALFQMGRFDEAIAQFHVAMQMDPTFPKPHVNLGDVLIKQGHIEEAIAEFREALRLDPDNVDASENLGNAFADQGKAQEAMAQYRESLRINPAYAPAHYDLGVALQQLGRMEEARAEYRNALQLDPAHAAARANLGIMFMQQGRVEEGIAEFREATRANPASVDAHVNLARALVQNKQIDEAIAELTEALRINPAQPGIEMILGKLLQSQGRNEEAKRHFQKARELQQNNAAVQK